MDESILIGAVASLFGALVWVVRRLLEIQEVRDAERTRLLADTLKHMTQTDDQNSGRLVELSEQHRQAASMNSQLIMEVQVIHRKLDTVIGLLERRGFLHPDRTTKEKDA